MNVRQENRTLLKLGWRPSPRIAAWARFQCICCPLLSTYNHCTLKSDLGGFNAPLLFAPSSASPSMRGSTPLDVAASSVMDNNELALGLEEPDLEKVTGETTLFFS